MFTFVIVNWKRPQNIAPIVKAFRSHPKITEAIVWDNAFVAHGETRVNEDGLDARVIRSKENLYLAGRFLAATVAKNEHVITCDDDFIPSAHSIAEIIEAYEKLPGHLVHALYRGHYELQANGRVPWALLGWGAAFPREAVRCLNGALPEDDTEVLRRKADYIFSMLCGLPVIDLKAQGVQLPEATQSMALYMKHDHSEMIDKAVAIADRIKHRNATATSFTAGGAVHENSDHL